MNVSIVWIRDDLRVADNPALLAAAGDGEAVALYVLDEQSPGIRPLGAAAKWWLHHALEDLRKDLELLGIPLILRRGPGAAAVGELATELDAGAMYWNRRYGGPEREVDAALKSWARDRNLHAESFQASLLHEPWKVTTGAGNPYQVFTPFWRTVSAQDFRAPLGAPDGGHGFAGTLPDSDALGSWDLLPSAPDWAGGLRETWRPTAAAGHGLLAGFLDERVGDYSDARDRPDEPGTSRLSPYLRWGQLSPFQVWAALAETRRGSSAETRSSADIGTSAETGSSAETGTSPETGSSPETGRTLAGSRGPAVFASELGWREFCWHQLYHHPDLATTNLRGMFDNFPWRTSGQDSHAAALLIAWQQGKTGIPLVDAGQRELWHTGFMHNRVRMVTASFLIKNLGFDWRVGEQWFWDTLVDADAASNPANWQWVAGSGADAAPYFRIFNPLTQARKFDPAAKYVGRWVPEVMTPAYPEPVVDLQESRRAALEGYASIKA